MMRMLLEAGESLSGELVYRKEDHSVDFIPDSGAELEHRTGHRGTASLGLGTLQLEVAAESGLVLFPWGYLPTQSWVPGTVRGPVGVAKGLIRAPIGPIEPGVTLAVPDHDWTPIFDASSGWIHIGDRSFDTACEFASDCILGIQAGALSCIWLRPSRL